MTTADKIATALRAIAPEGKLLNPDVPLINQLAANWDARSVAAPSADPPWIVNARSKIGRKEIVGPSHNSWIAKGWARLGVGWYNDDETPWCGFFIADCLNDVGLPYPKDFPAAASFKTYGVACPAQLGAIGVKARKGGNHVFFIVGETPDKKYYKALGGNQSNMVSIMDILKTDVDAIRWPSASTLPPRPAITLPVLKAGTVSVNEA